MDKRIAIGAGAGLAAALWLILARKSETPAESVARMLIAETGFARDRNEMAQIVYVAKNRAKKYALPIAQVVIPPGTPTWNGSAAYRDRFWAASQNPRFAEAVAFVHNILIGKGPANAGATSFVHPSGMPTPPCAENRTEVGGRCLPLWAAGGRTIGGAVFV